MEQTSRVVSTPAEYVTDAVTALVRAYGDEAVELRAFRTAADRVAVVGPDGTTTGYPICFVYEWDAQLFERLSAAYGAADCAQLERLWTLAKPF